MANKLNRNEQQIENALNVTGRQVASDEELEDLRRSARKAERINIRFTERDLKLIRHEADRLGIPYQTLIASVVHRFIEGELIDKTTLEYTLPLVTKKVLPKRRSRHA